MRPRQLVAIPFLAAASVASAQPTQPPCAACGGVAGPKTGGSGPGGPRGPGGVRRPEIAELQRTLQLSADSTFTTATVTAVQTALRARNISSFNGTPVDSIDFSRLSGADIRKMTGMIRATERKVPN